MLVKEELIQYMIAGHIHLSRQDYLFFSNLEKINKFGNVTTGQNKLFDKLLDKYSRQLKKLNLDSDKLKKLSWRSPLIETRPEFQRAELSLQNNLLVLRSPYNKGFNKSLREMFDSETFSWDSDRRVHCGKATTLTLKNIIKLLPKHFKSYVLCDSITEILENIKEYSNYIYTPTLINKSGNLYVIGCNESLHEQLKHIELKKDAKTFCKLAQLGVKISADLLDTEKLQFSASFYNNVDIDDLDKLCEWLTELGIHSVTLGHNLVYTRALYREVKDKLTQNNITIAPNNEFKNSNEEGFSETVLFQLRSNHHEGSFATKSVKVIFLQSKRPITVK